MDNYGSTDIGIHRTVVFSLLEDPALAERTPERTMAEI